MPFTFAADPAELIKERAPQWTALGIDPTVLEQMPARVHDLWDGGPGGWVHEWSELAEAAEKDGDFLSASLLYGIAKFPVLGNAAHARAYGHQIRTYLRASAGFEVPFERHMAEVPFRGQVVQVATHLYLPAGLPEDAPVVLALSGVDTWKMELHGLALTAARTLGARIATIDMAGTGESPVANGPDGEQYVAGVVDWLRRRFPRTRGVGTIGFSFGGHWTIKLALLGKVDAAVSVAGFLDTTRGRSDTSGRHTDRSRFGMTGIIGNSLRLDTEPNGAEVADAIAPFSLRTQGLLDDWGSDPVPLLYYNGAADPHIRAGDSAPLETRPNTVVRLVPNATHGAMEQAGELIPWSLRWLGDQLA